MLDGLINSDEKHELSVIKDPFLTENIETIAMYMSTETFSKNKYWWGHVTFKNGNTTGKQDVRNCDSFEKLLAGIKQVLNSVKDKK